MNNLISDFCRLISARSQEHNSAFTVLVSNKNYGIAIGLLRQELDSLIRVAYLCDHGADSVFSKQLMENTISNERWTKTTPKGKQARITDREMVEAVTISGLFGWEKIVYSFGSKLIHLSSFHDYNTIDPFTSLPVEDCNEIIGYMQNYHSYPDDTIDLERFADFLPKIMQKIIENVTHFVREIEKTSST